MLKKKGILYKLLKYSWILLPIILLIFFRKAIILLAFVILGPLPQVYKRFIPLVLGLELITFFTIIISYWINPFVAWLMMIPMIVLAMAFEGRTIHKFTFIKYTIVCFLAFILISLNAPIGIAGMIISILVNIMLLILMYFTISIEAVKTLPGLVINTILNIFLFTRFAQMILNILT